MEAPDHAGVWQERRIERDEAISRSRAGAGDDQRDRRIGGAGGGVKVRHLARPLRIAAFGSLAECAKAHGNRLENAQVAQLVEIVQSEPDMTLRTAASKALGSINLASSQASVIIRGYYGD